MRTVSKTKLRRLFLFGVLVTILLFPMAVSAHSSAVGNYNEGEVYDFADGKQGWDPLGTGAATQVGWFTHDKRISPGSSAKWGTAYYVITPYSLSDYTIPVEVYQDDSCQIVAHDCSIERGFRYVDATYLFDRINVYRWAISLGAKPDTNGVITVWANPVIKVTDYRNGKEVNSELCYSLNDWKRARPWRDPSSFQEHYNKPLHITAFEKNDVQIEYKTLKAGAGYDKETDILVNGQPMTDYHTVNYGSVQSYKDSGLQEKITGTVGDVPTVKKWILTGVRVEKSSTFGTSGEYTLDVEGGNQIEPAEYEDVQTYTLTDLSNVTLLGTMGENPKHTLIYEVLKKSNFRAADGPIKITFLYSEESSYEIILTTMAEFQGAKGEDGENALKPLSEDYLKKGKVEKTEVVPVTLEHDGRDWELAGAKFGVSATNPLKGISNFAPNEVWGNAKEHSFPFDVGRENDLKQNNRLKADLTRNSTYIGVYKIRPPQVELHYYRSGDGKLKLLKTTSGGKEIDTNKPILPQCQRNVCGEVMASDTVQMLWKDAPVTANTTKDLILTQSYVYAGTREKNVVKGYGKGSKKNCWTSKREPTGGDVIKETQIKSDPQTAYDEYKDGTKTRTTSVEARDVPLIFVYVYEGGPRLTVTSYYQKKVTEIKDASGVVTEKKTMYARLGANSKKEFTLALSGKDYTFACSRTVVYPLGTESIPFNTGYTQDSIDTDLDETITVNNKKYYLESYILTNEKEGMADLKDLGSSFVMEEDGNAELPWSDRKPESIIFKNGQARLVKLFSQDPRKAYWSVVYANLERDANGTKAVADSASVYKRMADPRLNPLSILRRNSNDESPFIEHVRYAEDRIAEYWTLTNVGKSTKEFNKDASVADLSGYAATELIAMESNPAVLGIAWKVDVNADAHYDTDYEGLKKYTLSWIKHAKLAYNKRNENALSKNPDHWVWGIYRADKAVNYVSVLKSEDGAYTLINDVDRQDLSPWTKEYSASMRPYAEHMGKTLKLTHFTSSVLESVPTDEELIANLETWFPEITGKGNVTYDGDGNSTGNVRNVPIYRKLTYVAGIYEEDPEPGDPGDEPEETSEVVKYRATTGTRVVPSSWNSFDRTGIAFPASCIGTVETDTSTGLSSQTDDRGMAYDAATSIPTTEYLRTSALVPKYLIDIDYWRKTYTKRYMVRCYQCLNVVRESKDKYGNVTVTYGGRKMVQDEEVLRSNYNYSLKGDNIYVPDNATIVNEAIAVGSGPVTTSVTMFAKGDISAEQPRIELGKNAEITVPRYEANDLSISYGVFDVSGDEDGKLEEELNEWMEAEAQHAASADSMIGPILAANQDVTFYTGEKNAKGESIVNKLLIHVGVAPKVADPVKPSPAESVAAGVFSSKNGNTESLGDHDQPDTSVMQVPAALPNGLRESTGTVHFRCITEKVGCVDYSEQFSGDDQSRVVEDGIVCGMGTNSVTLHTPVMISFTLEDQEDDSQQLDLGTGQTMVLDRPFTLTVDSKGSHNGNPGYGNRDYAKYLEESEDHVKLVQVKFPFPVMAPDLGDSGRWAYCHANTWINVPANSKSKFFLPSWADEGDAQLVRVRANAINARVDGNTDHLLKGEMGANRSLENYVAYQQNLVSVVGRIYGLSIIDVADYPLWEPYFRKGSILSGNKYYPGRNDQNGFSLGVADKFTYPMVDGSHPTVKNAGVLKPGYVIRFKIETVGNLFSSDDYVQIKPEFYYVNKETGERKKVSVYYNETINGKSERYVKIGSEKDKQNKKRVSLGTGDFGIPTKILKETANFLGYDSTEEFTNHESPIYTFGNMMLNQYVRTFVGKEHVSAVGKGDNGAPILLNLYEMESEDGKRLTDGDQAFEKRIASSVQNWYSTYYLPSEVFVTDRSDSEVQAAIARGEEPWLSGGYLVVRVAATAVNAGVPHLAYNAKELNEALNDELEENPDQPADQVDSGENQTLRVAGNCNMWEVEGYLTKKVDAYKKEFRFEYGDFLMFDLDEGGASSDYGSGGTQ